MASSRMAYTPILAPFETEKRFCPLSPFPAAPSARSRHLLFMPALRLFLPTARTFLFSSGMEWKRNGSFGSCPSTEKVREESALLSVMRLDGLLAAIASPLPMEIRSSSLPPQEPRRIWSTPSQIPCSDSGGCRTEIPSDWLWVRVGLGHSRFGIWLSPVMIPQPFSRFSLSKRQRFPTAMVSRWTELAHWRLYSTVIPMRAASG